MNIKNLFKQFINHISFLWHWKNFFFCLKYPFWKLRNAWDEKFSGYAHTMYDSIPYGWRVAFGKQLSEEIKKAGKESRKKLHKYMSWKKMLCWQEIKEKYGELRLYASATSEIEHILEKYEFISTFYCISCGKKAHYRTHDWIEYYCKDCFLKDLHRADKYRDAPLTKEDEENALKECRVSDEDIPEVHRYVDEELLNETFNTEEECINKQEEMYDKSIENMFYIVRENEDGTWSLIHTKSIEYKVDLEKEYNISFKELQSDEED